MSTEDLEDRLIQPFAMRWLGVPMTYAPVFLKLFSTVASTPKSA
jgi:hypothetical protein